MLGELVASAFSQQSVFKLAASSQADGGSAAASMDSAPVHAGAYVAAWDMWWNLFRGDCMQLQV